MDLITFMDALSCTPLPFCHLGPHDLLLSALQAKTPPLVSLVTKGCFIAFKLKPLRDPSAFITAGQD